jgi:uncharacterized repeat protein (TIGR03803 family)
MKTFRTAASFTLFGALMIATSMDTSAGPPFGLDVVHSFAGGGADGAIGSPADSASLIQATDGNFYGTTYAGGAFNAGTVFKMTPSGAVTVLHSFTGVADGVHPLAGLIQATTDGNFYGTTSLGGASNLGTVFTITPAGAFTTLYNFTGGTDGANPAAPLLQTKAGNFYGTTQSGGSANLGTIFVMDHTGSIISRYTFTGGLDGASPYAPVIQTADGSLYGTNYSGTDSTFGRIFKISNGVLSVMHTFASGVADGANPTAALVQANDGQFYGTTLFGGASDKGTAFRMAPDGTVTLLHVFTGGSDGGSPYGALIQAADGNLYGATRAGASGNGTIYQLTLAGTLTTVHTFAGTEGSVPSAPLLQAQTGTLYGTASFGGASGLGVVFRLTVTPTITTQPLSQAIASGQTATLSVMASGDGLSYQWYVGTTGTATNPIAGATASSYTTPALTSTTSYWVRVSNSAGTADSNSATITVMGAFAPVTVFRPSTGTWWVRGASASAAYVWGGGADIPVAGDYDGDGIIDIAVFRPSTGTWYIRYASGAPFAALVWGGAGDVPVPGDYDGDGITDIAVFRPSTGTWYIRYSSGVPFAALVWGGVGDVAVPGDYDGDGIVDIAVFRPSTGTWYVRASSGVPFGPLVWGGVGDIAVPGDYDGDERTDVAVFRPSTGTWYVRASSGVPFGAPIWGGVGDIAVPSDYDGDGKTDIAVFRPSTGSWYIRASSGVPFEAPIWGGAGDIPSLAAPTAN